MVTVCCPRATFEGVSGKHKLSSVNMSMTQMNLSFGNAAKLLLIDHIETTIGPVRRINAAQAEKRDEARILSRPLDKSKSHEER